MAKVPEGEMDEAQMQQAQYNAMMALNAIQSQTAATSQAYSAYPAAQQWPAMQGYAAPPPAAASAQVRLLSLDLFCRLYAALPDKATAAMLCKDQIFMAPSSSVVHSTHRNAVLSQSMVVVVVTECQLVVPLNYSGLNPENTRNCLTLYSPIIFNGEKCDDLQQP